jgi:hypothetical protein
MIWKTEKQMKKYVGIEVDEYLSLKYIGNIENAMVEFKINISGDFVRKSTVKSHYKISLKLENKKYSIKKPIRVVKGIAYEEKIPIIFDPDFKEDDTIINIFTENKPARMKRKTFDFYRKNVPDQRTLGILVKKEDIKIKDKKTKKNRDITLKEYYPIFIEEANALREATNGIVNMYITGRMTKTALDLFYKFVRTLKVDPILQIEGEWIHKSSHGAIMFAQKYSGPAYSYDFISHYLFIMQDHHMLFPIKEGQFLILTQSEFEKKKFVSYGIYRCKIYPSKDINKDKLFRFSKKDYYTHIDINSAIKEGFQIEMIEDGKPNFLFYSRDCLIKGNKLFKPYADFVFPLKQKKIPGAKKLSTCLWGTLTQSNLIKVKHDLTKKFIIYPGNKFYTTLSMNGIMTKTTIIKNDKFFETDFARIKPFLLAKGRYRLKEYAKPYAEYIKFMHTDSMITSKKIDIKIDDGLGKIKYEGYAKSYNIHHIGKKDSKLECFTL